MLRITEYAQRLIDDLEDLDYLERIKIQQRNWIGRSTGAEVDFATTAGDCVRVFTTRPDTLFGATYMVVSPEHELVEKWLHGLKTALKSKSTGSRRRKNPISNEPSSTRKRQAPSSWASGRQPVKQQGITIFISDYVLASTEGRNNGSPGHDERDWEFAKKFGLPIVEVVAGGNVQEAAFANVETGNMVNSGFLTDSRSRTLFRR
jgi:leucyl-tRNA synthetase